MFSLPELPYPYEALEPHIDTLTMKIHHDKHHGAYVDNLNKALEGKSDLLSRPIEDLLRNLNHLDLDSATLTKLRNHGGGHYNHSLFWTVMAPADSEAVKTGPKPDSPFIKALMAAFGDPGSFKEKFIATAVSHFGSGWAWLIVKDGKLEITESNNQDTPLSEGKTPIFGADVWEHAYYLKYQNRRADYINAWWNVVNWKQIEANYLKAIK